MRLRTGLSLGAAVLVTLTLSQCAAVPAAPTGVLIAGDSLAAGLFASTRAEGFRGLLFDEWSVDEKDRLTYGFPHGRLSEITQAEVPANVRLAVIEIGTNDFGKTPRTEFGRTYSGFLQRLVEKSPDVELYCLGLWRSTVAVHNSSTPDDYDRLIEMACENVGGTFVPLSPIFDIKNTRGPAGVETETGASDEFHPNDLGHRMIADAVLEAIESE